MKVLAFLCDPGVLQKILRHLKLPDRPPPLAPARLAGELFHTAQDEWSGVDSFEEDFAQPSWPDSESDPAIRAAGRDPPGSRGFM